MIIRARTVLPMEGEPIDNGAVAVSGNKITAVGRFSDLRPQGDHSALDLGEQVLMPGLINPHCHLDYTALRGRIPRGRSFADWIRSINAEKANLTAADYVASIEEGFAEALRFGTTTLVNLTAFPELIAAIADPVRTWWFGELIDIRDPDNAEAIVDRAVKYLKSATRWGLAPHALYTASARLYTHCEEIAERENIPLTTHLAESRDEMAMFRDASGPAFEFLQSIRRPMDDCGPETPLSLFLRTQTINDRWILAHLNELAPDDFDLLGRGPRFHVVHCPRSHAFFDHTPFPLARLRALGFNVALGTDSLASNSDLSLFAEMREALRKNPNVSPREVLEMATINGAAALRQQEVLGCLRAGAFADLIALPLETTGDVFDQIVAFEGPVPWTMIDGRIECESVHLDRP